ncbi:MAG TPA: hypothetical protein VE465_09105 [Streptosporangiaceae bacterium]|nr:hypothetical protein [Streptosporangiaceae bacterium]
MGHALDHSIQDTLVRRGRMRGAETLWPPAWTTPAAGTAAPASAAGRLRPPSRS